MDQAAGRSWAALENVTRARALAPSDAGIQAYYVTLLAANRVADPALRASRAGIAARAAAAPAGG
ncbi:hypothetical protein M8494_03625 [Serratia ureilytica]